MQDPNPQPNTVEPNLKDSGVVPEVVPLKGFPNITPIYMNQCSPLEFPEGIPNPAVGLEFRSWTVWFRIHGLITGHPPQN